jgi:hypothetical protein
MVIKKHNSSTHSVAIKKGKIEILITDTQMLSKTQDLKYPYFGTIRNHNNKNFWKREKN